MEAMRFAAPLLLALGSAGCVSVASMAGAAAGRAAAEADIAAGSPCLLTIGRLGPWTGIDRETGLPRRSIGCVVDDGTLAEVDAYNGAVRAALGEGRLVGMTFEDRWTTREAVATRFGEEGGIPLSIDGPPATAPGGRYRVEFASRDPREVRRPYLSVTDVGSGVRLELVSPGGAKALVLFDLEGRTLLMRDEVRSQTPICFLPPPAGRRAGGRGQKTPTSAAGKKKCV
jgi:hypothetical protein